MGTASLLTVIAVIAITILIIMNGCGTTDMGEFQFLVYQK